MREFFFLTDDAACQRFVAERVQLGHPIETFLGVGVFSALFSSITDKKGILIHSTPPFFKKELADRIVEGTLSPFEQEVFFSYTPPASADTQFFITRWLLVGQHLSLFHLSDNDVKRHLPDHRLLGCCSIEEVLSLLLWNIFAKVQHFRPQSLLFLFDTQTFCDYVCALVKWLATFTCSSFFDSALGLDGAELEKKVTSELLGFLADSNQYSCLAIFPSTQRCFANLINAARALKNQGPGFEELVFRL